MLIGHWSYVCWEKFELGPAQVAGNVDVARLIALRNSKNPSLPGPQSKLVEFINFQFGRFTYSGYSNESCNRGVACSHPTYYNLP